MASRCHHSCRHSVGRRAQDLTWYVLSKLSYMNRVIRDVFPTAKKEENGSAMTSQLDSSAHIPCE